MLFNRSERRVVNSDALGDREVESLLANGFVRMKSDEAEEIRRRFPNLRNFVLAEDSEIFRGLSIVPEEIKERKPRRKK